MGGQTLSSRTIARIFFTVVGLTFLLYLIYQVRFIVALVAIAVFVAIALGPAVDQLARSRVPRGLAILAVYAAVLLLIFTIGLLLVPPVVDQVDLVADDVPAYIEQIRGNATLREYDDKYDVTGKLQVQAEQLPSRLGDAAAALQAVTVGVFSALIQLLAVLTIAFFLLKDGDKIVDFALAQLRPGHEGRYREVAADIYRSTSAYVAGALAIALLCGVSSYVMLMALGVPFAVPLALLMAFLSLIPLVGATIGAVIVALVTLLEDFPGDTIIWVLFAFVYQQVETNIFQPQVYRRTVNLHPLVAIIAILVGAVLLGVLGAVLAIPIAASVQLLLQDLWAYRQRSPVLDAAGAPIQPGPSSPQPALAPSLRDPPEPRGR